MRTHLPSTLLFSTLLLVLLSGCSEEAAVGILAGGAAIWIVGSILLFILVVLALVDLWKKPYSLTKKLIWVVAILIVPYVGAILYFVIGRGDRTIST